jgi:deoxyribodipyrimidine photo-lyase
MTTVPTSRIHPCNAASINGHGAYVLYWMIANRRRHWNFALQRAVHWATELRKPLLIVEALSRDYRWASARIHTAILQGMRDNLEALEGSGAHYHAFVERSASQGKGMVAALARDACVVVTDDFPAFEIPRWIRAAAVQARVLVEKIDSNGIFPMRAADRAFSTAHSFRRFLQKNLSAHLEAFPLVDPLAGADLPRLKRPMCLHEQWPAVSRDEITSPSVLVEKIDINHSVRPVECSESGPVAARRRLKAFVRDNLTSYANARNHPDSEASSGLSAHLHFGHLSTHEVFQAVMKAARWSSEKLARRATGSRQDWWRAGINAEAFLEQLVTWRELGLNACVFLPDFDRYCSLPAWARKTLAKHAGDRRPMLYSPSQLENAETHDPLWNAAQTQLLREGCIHNYLRMLWGKKILEWSRTPEEALETMIHLNNKYALDGRDPNSYSGIFWILGRYDRAWGPERPVFGTVRYMSSDNTARKVHVRNYLRRYS